MPEVPSKLERIVAALIPARSREHVLGDLHERYRSPAQYVGDAMATVPMVVWSCVLRTSCPELVAIECATLGIALALAGTSPLLPALLLGTAALRLHDAYARPERRTAPASLAAALGAAFLLFASVAAPANLRPTGFAFAATLVVVWAIRVSVSGEAKLDPAAATLDEIPERARRFEKRIRQRNLREYCGAAVVILLVGRQVIFDMRAASFGAPAAILAGVAFIAWYLYRHGTPRKAPPAADMLPFYRGELERQAALLRNVFWWYLGPMIPGAMLSMAASSASASARFIGASICVALFLLVFGLNQRAAKALEREIETLDAIERNIP